MRTRLASLTALSLALTAPAYAQIDIGDRAVLIQDGVEMGQIYVPPDQDPCNAVEYWFLYEDFAFVSTRTGASFTVKALDEARDPESWGWERQMWEAHPKGRLLVTTAVDADPACR